MAEGRLTIDTPTEYLSRFQRTTQALGRYKTTEAINKSALFEDLSDLYGGGVTTTELEIYGDVIKYSPETMKKILREHGKDTNLNKYKAFLRTPLNEEENKEWEDADINKRASEMIESGVWDEEVKEEVDSFVKALGQGAVNPEVIALVGAKSLFNGIFHKGLRTDDVIEYQASLIAKNEALGRYLQKVSGGKAQTYKLAIGAGGFIPATVLTLLSHGAGVAGYTELANIIGKSTLTAMSGQAFVSSFEPGNKFFSWEGIKDTLQGAMGVIAMKSGLTAAKQTMGMNLNKAFFLDTMINTGVDIGQLAMDYAFGELDYDPVDMMSSSFIGNTFFFGLGRAGGSLKMKRLERIATDPNYAKKVLRGESAEKSSQRLKLLTLDILSETDVKNEDKMRVMNRALKSGLINTKDAGEIVNVYANIRDAGKFAEFKSAWADKALVKKAEVKVSPETRMAEEFDVDENAKLRDLEGERVEVVDEDVEAPKEVVSRYETATKKVDSTKYSEAETVKQAVDRMETEGKTDKQINAEMKKAGVEIKDVDEYRQAKLEFDVEQKIGTEIPKDTFSVDKTQAERDVIAKNMTPKEANEINNLKKDVDDYMGTIGAAKKGFSAVPIKQLRENMIKFITKNTSLNTRGKLLNAIEKAKTSGEIGEVMRRAMELEEAFQKRLNILRFKKLKSQINKSNKAGHIPAQQWNQIKNILDMYEPVKMSDNSRRKAMGEIRDKLGDMFDELESNPEVAGLLTKSQLNNLQRLGAKPLSDMSPREVKSITDDLQALFVAARNANTTIWNGKRIAKEKLFGEFREQAIKSTKLSKFNKMLLNSKFWSSHWHNDVFALMTGSKIFQKVFDTNITAGNRYMYDIQYKAEDMWTNSNVAKRFKNAIFDVYDPVYVDTKIAGSTHKLTESQLLKIYVLSKDQFGFRHLVGGEDSGLEIEGKIYKPTVQEIRAIQSKVEANEEYMTAVNKLQEINKYVWNEMNETFKRDTGRELDRREFYTMMEVSSKLLSDAERAKLTPEGGQTSFGRTMGANMSVIRRLTRSTKALRLTGLFESAHKSIERSSKYTAMREPTKQAYSFLLDRTNAQLIKETYGEQVYKRMVESIEDEMGVRYNPDELNSFMNKVLGNIALATLSFNVFSNLKTRTSLMAAMPYIENKYKMAGIASRSEIRSDSLLRLRADGKISPEISMARDVRFGTGKFAAKLKKAQHTGMKVIAEGDEWVVRKIYGMMKAKVEAEFPKLEGEERQRKIGELTYDIVRKSQPTFLTHDRPYSRRGNAFWRAIMPFSSQRIQNANLLMRGLIEYDQKGRTFEASQTLRSVLAYAWVIQSMLVAMVDILRAELMGYKIDENKTTTQRWLKSTGETMMGNIPLAGELISDMVNKVAGEYTYNEGITNIGFETMNNIISESPNAIRNWVKYSSKDLSQKEKEQYKERAERATRSSLTNIARLTGLPKVPFDLISAVTNYTGDKSAKKLIIEYEKKKRK